MNGTGGMAIHETAPCPRRDHLERLRAISRHFLSDAPIAPIAAPGDDAMQLPVVLALSPDPSVTPEPGYLLRALARQLNLPGTAVGQDWNVQVHATPAAVPRAGLVLLLVDPTLDATRNAFALIKQLHARGHRCIGVVYRAGADLAAARRCYHRLAVAAARFLGLALINLGGLPDPGPNFATALAHAAQVVHSQRRTPAPLEAIR
ncbi:MAG: hypothetical protein WCZ87_11050 [Thiohalobacteraceae bacterium]